MSSTATKKAGALKARWRAGETTFGAWMAIGDTMVAEIMAQAGFDWVFIDLEHTAIGFDTLQAMLIAMDGSATVPIVRVPDDSPATIKRVLDLGAGGILVPNILSAAQAAAVVAAAKYPPTGIRGWGPWRASRYFAAAADYMAQANADLIVMVQIEHVDAVAVADAIAGTEGLDAICTGPADLAFSMGLSGQAGAPECRSMLERIAAAGRARGLPVAHGVVVAPADIAALEECGIRILPVTSDVGELSQGPRQKLANVSRVMGRTLDVAAKPASGGYGG